MKGRRLALEPASPISFIVQVTEVRSVFYKPTTRSGTECFFRAERQPYVRAVLCPTSMIYPSGSRI
jgi:hypothetical protein